MSFVTRFAPSPTGFLHVGGARTALFNWLWAKNMGGRFVLRVEDTDRERSTPEATQAILDSMQWLGLTWDELHYQSQREERHNEHVQKLLDNGQAYWCECTPEQVDAMREKARADGKKPKYDGTCREKGLGPGPGRVARLKAPLDGDTGWTDVVKGFVSFPNTELDDLILKRSDGSPTYNLAVVADDADMGITHIIRGDDHVSNTPKQILIYKALGLTPPIFGHVPMILGSDKKKLSKRHGAESVTQYRDLGYLPEAMRNYLLRLGWSHGDKEIFSLGDMVRLFTPDNLGTSPAVFDVTKLNTLNAHYIKEADPAGLAGLLMPFLAADEATAGLTADQAFVAELVPMYQPRAQTLAEMPAKMAFFLVDDDALEYDPKAAGKFLTEEGKGIVSGIRAKLAGLDTGGFGQDAVQAVLEGYLEEEGLKFKAIAQPLRVALSGSTVSPGLSETMAVLGKERTLRRLERALAV